MRTPPNNGAPHDKAYWHDSSILILTAKKELALKKKKHIIFGNRSPIKSGEDTISTKHLHIRFTQSMTEEQPKASLQPSSGNSNATISPSPAKNNNPCAKMSGAVSPSAAKNPYLKMSPTSPTATNVLASPSPPCASKSSSTLTDEQRTKIEENRKRALERRVASLVEQEPNKKARLDAPKCLRCGSYDKNTLCIKWDHDGDIERERAFGSGPYGWDAFRYDCCGRLAPNPCFVGQHNFGTTSSNRHLMGMRNMVLQCDCHNGPARLVETKKEGPNCGRYFFRCSSDRRADCKFFMWADVAFNLPPQRRQPSRDGIKEWISKYMKVYYAELDFVIYILYSLYSNICDLFLSMYHISPHIRHLC